MLFHTCPERPFPPGKGPPGHIVRHYRHDRRRACHGAVRGAANYWVLVVGARRGGTIGLLLALRVQMTQMPELVAILHSLVGMAAMLIGFANYLDPGTLEHYARPSLLIHDIETCIGIFIGAVTFTGSVIAFGKLSARISGKPMTLPGRHFLNLVLLVVAVWAGIAFVMAHDAKSTCVVTTIGGNLLPAFRACRRHSSRCAS